MIRRSPLLRRLFRVLVTLSAVVAAACGDPSPVGGFAPRAVSEPPPDAASARWWDAAAPPPDEGPPTDAATDRAAASRSPEVRTRLVSFATTPRWLGGSLTGPGALLVWDAGDTERHELVALALAREGKARDLPRPVLSGPGGLESASLTWDWRRDVVLLVVDTPAGTRTLHLDASGAPLGPPGALGARPDPAAPRVSSAALRTPEGFLVAHADGPDAVALTALPAAPDASPPPPRRLHLPGARRLQLADTGEGRYLAYEGPGGAGLRRLDTDADPLPWSRAHRTDLLADGDGLLAITCLGTAPGDPGAVVAGRLDAEGRPRGDRHGLAKSAVPCDFEARLRPLGGLLLRHGRHVTRFDAALRPEGEPGFLPRAALPPVLLWGRDAALVCGVWPDALGETLDCLTMAP